MKKSARRNKINEGKTERKKKRIKRKPLRDEREEDVNAENMEEGESWCEGGRRKSK